MGARLIDCDFKVNSKRISKKLENDGESKIFNIKYFNKVTEEEREAEKNFRPNKFFSENPYKFIFSEKDIDIYLNSEDIADETTKTNTYHLRGFPRYYENPGFYNGNFRYDVSFSFNHDDDFGQKLCVYYKLIDFIREYVKTLEDYESKSIQDENLCYSDYIAKLFEEGHLQK